MIHALFFQHLLFLRSKTTWKFQVKPNRYPTWQCSTTLFGFLFKTQRQFYAVISTSEIYFTLLSFLFITLRFSHSLKTVCEVNLAPAVNRMLSNCDNIIQQHKAACLRVTSLLAHKDIIWVGTSAGVLLTVVAQNVGKSTPVVTGKYSSNSVRIES